MALMAKVLKFIIKNGLVLSLTRVCIIGLVLLLVSNQASLAEANCNANLPDDIQGLNRSQLNLDMFSVVNIMNHNNDHTSKASNNYDLQEYIRKLFLLTWRQPIYDISEIHRYDSLEEKLISGGPNVNYSECSEKLRVLVNRVKLEQANGSSLIGNSKDFRLFNLLDSYGRPEKSFLRGTINWLGDYDQCIKARYNYNTTTTTNNNNNNIMGQSSRATTATTSSLSRSRYCLAQVRWPDWTLTQGFNEWKYTTIKSAICIPEACDTLASEQEENKQMIYRLMELNYGSAYRNFQVGAIYCLPDKQSPITQWQNDLTATSVVMFFAIWLTLVTLATLIDLYGGKRTRTAQANFIQVFSVISNGKKLFDFTRIDDTVPVLSAPEDKNPDDQQQHHQLNSGAKKVQFDLANNVHLQHQHHHNSDTSRSTQQTKQQQVWTAGSNWSREQQSAVAVNGSNNQQHRYNTTFKLVDLNFMHCIKAILLFIVMRTHFFLFTTPMIRVYDIAQSWQVFDIYHLALAGTGVNIFLMITGTIIAYLIFSRFPPLKHHQSNQRQYQQQHQSNQRQYQQQHQHQQQTKQQKQTALKETLSAVAVTKNGGSKLKSTPAVGDLSTGEVHHDKRVAPLVSNSDNNISRAHPLTKPTLWLGLGISRYLRLMPMLVMVTLVSKYLGKYLGSGPMWDYGTSVGTNSHQCRQESWLLTFLALVNWRIVYENCVPSAWYLAIDLQCSIVLAPLMIIAYYKAPRATFLIGMLVPPVWTGVFFVSDVYLHPLARTLQEYSAESVASSAIFTHEMAKIYYHTFGRIPYFFMGITIGYLLHIYETRAINRHIISENKLEFLGRLIDIVRRPVLSNWLTISTVFILIFIPGFLLPYLPKKYLLFYFGQVATVHVCFILTVFLYAYLMPIIILQLSTGSLATFSSPARKFLNWSGWLPVSRISLSFLLLDPIIVLLLQSRLSSTVVLNFDTHLMIMIFQSVVIYLASFVCYLVLEAPMRTCLMMMQRKLVLRYESKLHE